MSEIADWFGQEPSRELAAFLADPVEPGGVFRSWESILMRPELDEDFAHVLRNRVGAIEAFTGCVFLGDEGWGRTVFAHLETGRIFVHDPSVDQIRLLADSLESFLELDRVMAAIDAEAVMERGEIDPEVRLRVLALEGRIRVTCHSGAECAYDELLVEVAGRELELDGELDDPVEVRSVLAGIAREVPTAGPGLLGGLWRAFLDGSGPSEAALAVASEHPARVVRGAAALIRQLDAGERAEWSHLRSLGPVLRDPPQPTGKGSADTHDREAYAAFGRGDWAAMEASADASIQLRPGAYYAWMQRAIARIHLGRHRQAIADLDQGLCRSDHEHLWLNKTCALLELGEVEPALRCLANVPRHRRAATLEDLAPELEPYGEHPILRRLSP